MPNAKFLAGIALLLAVGIGAGAFLTSESRSPTKKKNAPKDTSASLAGTDRARAYPDAPENFQLRLGIGRASFIPENWTPPEPEVPPTLTREQELLKEKFRSGPLSRIGIGTVFSEPSKAPSPESPSLKENR